MSQYYVQLETNEGTKDATLEARVEEAFEKAYKQFNENDVVMIRELHKASELPTQKTLDAHEKNLSSELDTRPLWTPDDMKWFMEDRLRKVEGSEELKFALASEGLSLEELKNEVKQADTFLDLPLVCRSVINEAEFAINMRELEKQIAQEGNETHEHMQTWRVRMNADNGQRWVVVEATDGEKAIEKAFDICQVGTVDKSVRTVSVELMEAERLDNVSVIETAKAENTNTINGGKMEEASLRSGYAAQQQRIEQLETWIQQAITRPSMPRELRLEGLDLFEGRSLSARTASRRADLSEQDSKPGAQPGNRTVKQCPGRSYSL